MSYEEEDTSIKHTRGVEPIFPGRNLQDQIEQICEVLLYFCSSIFFYFFSITYMHTYIPHFPGKNFQDQIEKICEVLGNPTPQDLRGVTSVQKNEKI